MSTEPQPPADALLIRQRREAAAPPMSRRQAAVKAGISPSQWSDIERGSKMAGQGTVVPIRATAETLARMARVVGATANELTAAGRSDAADLLQAAEQDRGLRQRLAAIPGLGTIGARELTEANGQELLPIIAASLDAIEASDLPSPARRELTSMLIGNLVHDASRRHTELLLILRIATSASQQG
jgi:transcriptional regulator with XRE-family HTH domain